MPYSVRCKACSAVFAIPDDIWNRRVRGRLATLKCRSCKGDIQVDGTKADAGKLSEAPTSEVNAATAPAMAPATPSAPKATAPVVSAPVAEPPALSPPPPSVKPGLKPIARAPSEIAAAETGWSIMPPPAALTELEAAVEAPKPIVLTPAATPSAVAPTLITTPVATPAVPPQAEEPADLWVVSYGEDDDRELTEKQIAAELSRGKINATTIVWREEMPEWLPLSGVKELAKYLPTTRPRPAPTAKSVATGARPAALKTAVATPAQAQKQEAKPFGPTKAATPTPAQTATRAPAVTSTVPRQPTGREKQPSATRIDPNAPNATKQELTKQPATAAKGPPILSRTAQKSAETLSGPAETASRVPQPTGGKPPPLAARITQVEATETSVPWRKAQESNDEEILTSAPNLDQVSAFEPPKPAAVAAAPAAAPQTVERSLEAAPPAAFTATPAAQKPQPSPAQAAARASFRPPKPVETATSLVVHSHQAPSADVLEITDEDFLAMQRRFPKWALPAAIGGGVIVLGLIIYAAVSGEEPPPLPVAPVLVPTNAALGKGNRAPQPDLDSVPTTTNKAPANNGDTDFASAFAKAAGKATGNFDAKAAERAASAAMERAAKCHADGEVAGLVRAVVSIAPSGQVTGVQVSPPHANLATGKCVEKALRNFTVRPFQGEPAKLPLSIGLR